jgi:CRP-like cAMP-binding protein
MAINPFQNFMVRYGANERIFTEGDLGTTMYIVQSGKIRLFRLVDGQKRVHGMMDKGDFFGEMSILEGLPRTNSAEAVEDAELIEINSMTFDKMI